MVMVSPPKNVLIVEDQEENRVLLGTICSRLGLNVTEAVDGLDGLEKSSAEPKPDLIFMDIRMPKMDGYKCIKHIREQDTETPIVIITAEPESIVKSNVSGADVDSIITKPFRIKNIQKLLSEHFSFET
jgi:CheY-like chemotaxis protein